MPKLTLDISELPDLDGRMVAVAKTIVKEASDDFLKTVYDKSPHRSNKMRAFHAEFHDNGLEARHFSSADYVDFVEEGTGIYGPKNSPILPSKKQVLTGWTYEGKTVFARSVKGQKGQHMVKKSMEDVATRLPQHFTVALNKNGG